MKRLAVVSRFLGAVFFAVAWFAMGDSAVAQLSPGDLSTAHSFLDGVQNCEKCHGTKREVARDKCLTCHTAIKVRLGANGGLHGLQAYANCEQCHVEHQGREVALIYWKEGQNKFNHSLTGWPLDGKHATRECRTCHQPKFIANKSPLEADKTKIENTFLGLDRACKSCHFDEHRGQVSSTCTDCHSTAGWKPASGFDHQKAKFTLDGKHTTVPCQKCHLTLGDPSNGRDTSYLKFAPLVFGQCTDCHTDVHKGKLGPDCRNCHSTAGWQVTDKAKFDHSKTRYPLEGKHASVTCDKCHTNRKSGATLRFAACRDCHSDFHRGEFAKRKGKGACEECHTVWGFTPARFLMAQHDSSGFPLKEAHRAVPCLACHTTPGGESGGTMYRFAFGETTCLTCHRDPHRGELAALVKNQCDYCHSEASWIQVTFDHNLTEFRLEGKHISVTCAKCHTGAIKGEAKPGLTFVGAGKQCQECHKDIHRGQFMRKGELTVACGRCHSPSGWKPTTFDHNAESRFRLDGAHIRVPCAKCHIPKLADGVSFTQYKPLDTACASCHGAPAKNMKEKKS